MFARATNPPWSTHAGNASTTAIIDFPDDVVVTYAASWAATGFETSWTGNWRFDCEHGVVRLRDDEITVQRKTGDKGRHYLYDDPENVEIENDGLYGQQYLLDELKQAINGKRQPATVVQDNIHSFRMVMDAIESCQTGRMIRR
jgi:predicted dehydrogenase